MLKLSCSLFEICQSPEFITSLDEVGLCGNFEVSESIFDRSACMYGIEHPLAFCEPKHTSSQPKTICFAIW
jgi:hypothetical protein